MASSSTEIANMALSHLGVSKEIANLDTERSIEAAACRAFFATARDATMADFPWPFCTKVAALGLVDEDPTDEWSFSYRYPADCLMLRRMLSGMRPDTRQSRVSFELSKDASGILIFTNLEDAVAEYTVRMLDIARWPSDFVLMVSQRIAGYIAPRVTAGDPFKLGVRALQLYSIEGSMAKVRAANEIQPEEDPKSDLERARD